MFAASATPSAPTGLVPPEGFAFVVDDSGNYFVTNDGGDLSYYGDCVMVGTFLLPDLSTASPRATSFSISGRL
jgi:hypothetical protein